MKTIELSPYNRAGVLEHAAKRARGEDGDDTCAIECEVWGCTGCGAIFETKEGAQACDLCPQGTQPGEPLEEIRWECPDCSERHEDEDAVVDCCKAERDHIISCPVCGALADGYLDAADCCLWKDLDMATRYRIADAVEAGSTWADALGVSAIAGRETGGR